MDTDTEPAQPDTMARARRVDELRADAINLRTEEAHCRKRCQAIAQRIMAADAAYSASRALPIGDPGRLDAALALLGFVWETPTLAAAYLDLRAKLDAVNGRLREAQELLSDMVSRAGPACSARGILTDPHCDDDDCDNCDLDDRVIAALEPVR